MTCSEEGLGSDAALIGEHTRSDPAISIILAKSKPPFAAILRFADDLSALT
jgi:hypothetical protein